VSYLNKTFSILAEHELRYRSCFNLVPSENIISPMSRQAFLSDSFNRYFFDEKDVFEVWTFQGGSIVGRIQKEVLFEILRKVGRAKYVDVRSISGLTGMTLALAAFGGEPGQVVYSVPPSLGGHPDTGYVGKKFGYVMKELPFANCFDLDLERLHSMIRTSSPSMVYLDHATSLFPLDLDNAIKVIRDATRERVHVHVDSSHVNGLIWGEVFGNPLDAGADSYGGSTHKTFPGPHKAVLFTNSSDLSEKLTLTAVNMISHHHMSDVVALTISLIEFVECGGRDYVKQTCKNAKAFATALHSRDFDVQGAERGFTANHQVWIDSSNLGDAYIISSRLFEAGFTVNAFNPIPTIGKPGIRMGLNEVTKLGLKEDSMETMAELFKRLLLDGESAEKIKDKVAGMRHGLTPQYCFSQLEFKNRFDTLMRESQLSRDENRTLDGFLYS